MKNNSVCSFALLLLAFCPVILHAQWANDPMENTVVRDAEGLLSVPHVAVTPSGNSYISWYYATEELRFDVYLQYFDIYGNKLWDEDGLLISDHPTFTWVSDYGLAIDNEGYAILAFQDKRDGFSNAFAYRISPDGVFTWGEDGIRLTDGTDYDWTPLVLVTDDNDFIFTYTIEPLDTTQSWKIGIQKVDAAGNRLWGENILTGPELDYYMPQTILTEQGNLMVSWLAKTSLPDTMVGQQNWLHVFLQKFGSDGLPVWSEPVQADTGNLMAFNAAYIVPYLANNGADGAYVIWQSFFLGNPTVMVNNLSADGQVLWQGNGMQVETSIPQQSSQPSPFYDPVEDNLYVSFLVYKYDEVNLIDCWTVGGQKFSPEGDRLWGEHAKLMVPFMCSMDSAYIMTIIKPADEGRMCLFYEKEYDTVPGPDKLFSSELYAGLLNADGMYLWPGEKVPISMAVGHKGYFTAGDYSQEQWITAWADNRQHPDQNFFNDIYAQNVTIHGALGPLSADEPTDPGNNSLTCYPNPFKDKVTVTGEISGNSDVILKMTDSRGRTVLTYLATNQSKGQFSHDIETRSLSPGFYIIELQTGDGTFREKILKQ